MTAPLPLRYVGRPPDTDATVSPKSYADTQYSAQAVTTTVVTNKVNLAAANLTTKSYVDQQDNLRAHKTDVTAADLDYVNATELGVTIAKLDSSGFLPAGAIPAGIITDKVAQCYSVASPAGALGGTPTGIGTIQLTGEHTVQTTVPREYQIATIPVPDPGYPWRALPFAWVRGKSGGTPAPTRHTGNANYGLLTVMAPPEIGNTIYGAGICTASTFFNTYPVMPHAQAGQTPLSVPAIQGALELRLYGSCWSGASYVYSPVNLVYFILVIPAL